MTDYGHELRFGAFLTPEAGARDTLLPLAATAEHAGLDLLTFQDHPYQPSFLDTWTLLSYLAARTERITLAPNVANVPLRPPAVLARSAASLDVLTGGRVALGLGAGYFFDAIAALGGPRRSAGAHVDALAEAVEVIRRLWTPGPPVHYQGHYYALDGARPGPEPAHAIELWLGAYGPRMLALTATAADAWVPTLAYAGPEALGGMTRTLDAAAVDAGRDPAAVQRLYNIAGAFADRESGYLNGPPQLWANQLTELVLEHGFSGFILAPGADAAGDLQRFAGEVAPAVREAVGAHRQRASEGSAPAPAATDTPTGSDDVARVAAPQAERLVEHDEPADAVGRAGQQTLLAVHQQLRSELEQLRGVMGQLRDGQRDAAEARGHLNQMTMRQNYWTVGAFCASYCRVVAVHHAIEDAQMFPDLRAAEASLGPVLDRLAAEHEVIAGHLEAVDEALSAMIEDEGRLADAEQAVERLADRLLAHLDDEEQHLLEPIGRLSIRV